jgi:beta-mannosidase
MQDLELSTGWQLKQRDPAHDLLADFAAADGWIPASAPGSVYLDLLAAGAIPDPFVGLNENEVQWVGEADWLYRCTFDLPPDAAPALALCFDGLDTFATAWLNGEQVLSSDNMFIPQRVMIGRLARPGANELRILFESAIRHGKAREAARGALQAWNGDVSRVYVRKAQYHYGWDWGPTLMDAGPWRAVRLEAYSARIAEFDCPAEVAVDLATATLPVRVIVEAPHPPTPSPQRGRGGELVVRLDLHGPDGVALAAVTIPVEEGVARHTFTVESPQLWWPTGYGAQPLYRLVATLQSTDDRRTAGGGTGEEGQSVVGGRWSVVEDTRELRLGLRRLRLVQEPIAGEPGTTFLFEVNNTPIYCGGANWIPTDSFIPRVPAERYRAQIQAAADAHMVMLRVWGGGIYEEEVFYDLCDELGLMVWQDFMFACGIYPAYPEFQASVRAEAEAQVRRLRHHPSIVLWCGNNEDYQIAASNEVYDPAFDGDFTTTGFPARAIYERLLPEVCAALDPTRPYWPGSPYGGEDGGDPTFGDRHTWDIWHGVTAPYQDYPKYMGRLVTEFGMQAAPDMATIEAFTPPEERYPESRTFEHHNKAAGGTRRLAVYLNDNLRAPTTLEDYVYATQFVQAEALAAAVRGWRRRWGGPGRYANAGALVWQINDCWPVTSWAFIDYALRLKPAYYALRRELAPLAVGLARGAGGDEVWAVNGTLATLAAELELRAWTLDGEPAAERRQTVTLAPNQATELGMFDFVGGARLVSSARLLVRGEVVARAVAWPEPFKYLTLPDPAVEVARAGDETLRVRAARPAKGVLLAAGDGVAWSNNLLDLLPGDEQTIVARGLGDGEVRVRWLRG